MSAVLISRNHSVTGLSLLPKNGSKSDINSFCIWTLHGLSYLRLILGDSRQALTESRLHLRHVVVQVCPRGPGLSLEALKAVGVQFPSGGPI